MKWKSLFAAALSAVVAWPALAQSSTGGGIPSGRVISVNVQGHDSDNDNGEHESIRGQEGSSGLVPVANANWNELGGTLKVGTGTIANLKDDTGAATSASFTSGLGNGWSLTANINNNDTPEVTKGLIAARVEKVGLMGDGFRDANAGADVTEVTLTGIPYAHYNVILYYATGRDGFTWAPAKVTTADGTVTYYSYTGSETGDAATPSTSDPGTWGSSDNLVSTVTTGTYGNDVMLIEGLSGATLSIDLGQNNNPANTRGGLFGFQIVEVLPSISVNFAGDESGTYSVPIPKTSEVYGLFPVPGSEWENGFTGSGTIQVSSAYGSSETFLSTLSYKSKNIWHNTDSYDTLLQTYLDDGTDTTNNISGASISMDNVPFTEYAVIVYCAGGNSAFLPVTVNGKTYTWSDTDNATVEVEGSANFGSSSVTTPTLGKNALCVTGLTDAALTVQGQSGGENTARGGIAAIQIICTGEVDASLAPAPEAETSVISLNFGSNYGSVPQTADTYGLIPVPGYTWTNISRANGSQTVTVASGKLLTKEPTVDYKSDLTYFYNQATDPFLKGYLDDGQRSEGVGASVTVTDLPFWAYDVVVYAGLGDGNSSALPVRVNGTLYTWDSNRDATIATDDATAAYGGIQPTAQYGRNALRVKGLSDYDYKLTVQGLPRSDNNRGGIAAIQIVERKVIQNDNIGDLGPDSDTPVHILLTDQISGDLTLPPDAILDLSMYWLYRATPPITGTLTVNEGTQIRLPKGASWTIAGTIEGADSLADNAVIVDGSLATGVKVSGGTISADATYVWTGSGKNDLWSNQYNWSSHTVPDAEADVTIPLAANGAVTIELPSDAVAKSVTITGPESGAATLALTSAEGGATGSLTVSGRMLATGNVTVTQSADITVRGATKTGVFYPGTQYETTQPVQAGFHIHQGTWKILSGTLDMPPDGGNLTGEAGISGDGTLIVGGEGASDAKLAVHQLSHIFYNETLSLAYGTLRVAAGGTLTASNAVSLAVNYGHTYTVDLAGGTIETPTLATFAGVTVSAASTLRAPEGGALAVTASGSNDALTGAGGVTLSGAVTIASALATYSGTLTVSAGSALTLSGNARPRLVLVSGATEAKTSLTVTRTDDEAESGTIVFPTTMTAAPTNVTYTVNGLDEEEKKTLSVDVSEGQLTLSWEVKRPTLSTTSDWSTTDNWTNLPDGTTPTYPTSDSVTLDGTKSPITVTLNTDLSEMTYIFVKGNVTLVTTNDQPTIPACVALGEGATLTIGADFSGLGNDKKWTLPAGRTLQVTKGFTSFAYLTLNGKTVILEGASGSDGEPNTIEASNASDFVGGLTIQASNLKLTSMYHVGTVLELLGENIRIEGLEQLGEKDPVFYTNAGTQVVNRGSGNEITNLTGHNGSLAVETGSLKLTHQRAVVSNFTGATIAGDATLTLAGPANAQQWWFPATGEGTLVLEGAYRPMFSAVSQEATTLPKNMVFTATAAEQAAGLISCLNNNHSAKLPEDFTVKVNPAEGGGAWAPNPVLVQGGNSYLQIYNQLPTNLPAGVDEAVATAIQQAAKNAGIENKGYAVQLRTKGGQTTIASPDAETLNDVLGCFDNLTATADTDKTTLTYAYDFGIVGIARNDAKTGWVVTAKVQGEGAAQAGFAKGNAYVLSVTAGGTEKKVQLTGESGVNEANITTGTVELTVPDTALEGVGDGFTLGVSVSRTAQQL